MTPQKSVGASTKGFVSVLLAALIFGLYPAALRGVYADGGNAVAMLVLMTVTRALGLAGYCFAKREPLFRTNEDRKQALIGGAFQACSIIGIFLSLLYIPGPLMIIVVFTHTLMLLFFMAWRGEIKLGFVNVTTTLIALLGLTFVLDVWHVQSGAHWLGFALAFMSALATLSRLYVYGHQTQERHPIVVGAENFLVAAILTLPALFFETPHLPVSLIGNIYVLIGAASLTFGSFFMFWGISFLGAFQYSLIAKVEPIFTSLFSALLLGEVLKTEQYAGIILVTGSLAAYQLLSCKKKLFELR